MEKNTVLAIVFSAVVLIGWMFLQPVIFPRPENRPAAAATGTVTPGQEPGSRSGAAGEMVIAFEGAGEEAPAEERRVVIETRRATVVLSSLGGDMVSFRLREHSEGGEPVEMIFTGKGGGGTGDGALEAHAFQVAFGDRSAVPLRDRFSVNRLDDYTVEFYRDYAVPGADGDPENMDAGRFRLTKRYTFSPDEYMFELAITLDGGREIPALNAGGLAYTLGFGPQIGPAFTKLDGRSEYRRYITYANGKRREEKIREGTPVVTESRLSWAAVAGKYFALIAVPDATAYTFTYLQQADSTLGTASRLYAGRPPLGASKTTDVFRFYLGPKTQSALAAYDSGVNAFSLRDMELSRAASSSGLLAPVEAALKWILMLCYRLVPNWGLAIILMTLVVKIILFPLTYKSSEGTMRMQTISPRIKELQEKYKNDQAQLQQKMMDLYKQEGYNPMSGCVIMLIQFPILIAMYNLFSNHFDLRGAMFVPGWIPDLSQPESIWNFAPFRVPFLGWSDLRLLPFIYVGSQLLSSKITQTPDQQNQQVKMMMIVMPVMFFFLLYNMPSGLTVYWIMTNVLSTAQQLMINQYLKRKKEARAAREPSRPVIAPRGSPRRKKRR